MNPFFSIITPTLQRESLVRSCKSISDQSFESWQHLVMVDCDEFNFDLIRQVRHPKRRVMKCEKAHINGGNSCRHNAWDLAVGKYCLYLDDDNYLSDSTVLTDIATALQSTNNPEWAIFPIDRLGLRFYTDPPKSCHTDTLNLVLKRDIAQWPDTTAYGSDGVLVEDLMARGIPYAAFPNFRPIGVIPRLGFCQKEVV